MSAPPKKQSMLMNNVGNFIVGGIAGMSATCVIQPLDMVKTRFQLYSESKGKIGLKGICKDLYTKEGGIKGFYRGLGAALMRQIVYTTMRLGIFYTIMDMGKEKRGRPLNAGEKALASLFAGGVSAFMATPFDLALIRFQADGTLPLDQRRNYKNVFEALFRITKEEKFFNLWKGAFPTIVRAMALNLGMLMPYEECKQHLKPYWGETYKTFIASSFIAGLLASWMCLPFDNVKTKVQKMKKGPDGKYPYNGLVDCAMKSIKNEGLLKLWVGFPVFYIRIGTHAMITLLVSDALKYTFMKKNQFDLSIQN
eukprot:TRINITY_DN13_c0_g1_i3.p1 TRINITY_DN13_c0_g1~~TRINITY_DN13_c0_g1_i3.p1  ORF type:complete len:310 (+),score=45.87 TRINITY_DN13_c0_g1_i3:168-1097(+)